MDPNKLDHWRKLYPGWIFIEESDPRGGEPTLWVVDRKTGKRLFAGEDMLRRGAP